MEVNEALGLGDRAVEYDVGSHMTGMARLTGRVRAWDTITWAYGCIVSSWLESVRVICLEAVGNRKMEDSGADEVVFVLDGT